MYRKIGGVGDGWQYTTSLQEHKCDPQGTATVTKNCAGPFSKEVGEPDSDY
jgi:hypothetical protein